MFHSLICCLLVLLSSVCATICLSVFSFSSFVARSVCLSLSCLSLSGCSPVCLSLADEDIDHDYYSNAEDDDYDNADDGVVFMQCALEPCNHRSSI